MDLLWKRNDFSGHFVDIFTGIDSMDKFIAREVKIGVGVRVSEKKNTTSTQVRELGNKKIQEGKWYEAMRLYNISLCYAEIGTENISLAYANRSWCFLKLKKYHQCLIDIELAVNANYPQSAVGKLEKRREFCLKQIKNVANDTIAPELDFDVDENFAGMSSVLQMNYNEEFGRHFVGKCDIDVGKVVMIEEAFINSPIPGQRNSICDTCFKHAANFIVCQLCNGALFCNQTCEDNSYHVLRCGRGGDDDDFLVEIVLRSVVHSLAIFSGDVDNWKNFVQQVIEQRKKKTLPKAFIDLKTKYQMFLELNLWLSADERQTIILRGFEAYQLLMRKFEELFDGLETHRFLMHLIVMHTSIILCNIFQNDAHGGIFLLQNHFNHSCAPNLLHYENKTVVITSRQIKKGDQLFISYGKDYFLESLNNRRTKLYKGFGFHCECEKCKNDKWPISSQIIESDLNYQLLTRDSSESELFQVAKKLALKKKCIELFIKYSASNWCSQLDTISHMYQNLSTETLH